MMWNRQEFLKQGSSFGATLALTQAVPLFGQGTQGPIKVALVGVGRRGSNLLKILLEPEHVQIVALGDLREDREERAQRWVTDAGQPDQHKPGMPPNQDLLNLTSALNLIKHVSITCVKEWRL